MDEKREETHRQEPDTAVSPPRFMKTINGWLIGLSGIAVTVVGLRAAVLQLMPNDSTRAPDRVQVAGKPVDTDKASSQSSISPAASVEKPLPIKYEIPGGTLAFDGSKWIESRDNGSTAFKEISRDPNGVTVIFDEDRKMYLRWPSQGGQVEWSIPDPLTWTELYYAKAVLPT